MKFIQREETEWRLTQLPLTPLFLITRIFDPTCARLNLRIPNTTDGLLSKYHCLFGYFAEYFQDGEDVQWTEEKVRRATQVASSAVSKAIDELSTKLASFSLEQQLYGMHFVRKFLLIFERSKTNDDIDYDIVYSRKIPCYATLLANLGLGDEEFYSNRDVRLNYYREQSRDLFNTFNLGGDENPADAPMGPRSDSSDYPMEGARTILAYETHVAGLDKQSKNTYVSPVDQRPYKERSTDELVVAMLGTACTGDQRAQGCYQIPGVTNQPCSLEHPEAAVQGRCNFKTIAVPWENPVGSSAVHRVYQALDVGAQIKLQLQRALIRYGYAAATLPIYYDRALDRHFGMLSSHVIFDPNTYVVAREAATSTNESLDAETWTIATRYGTELHRNT